MSKVNKNNRTISINNANAYSGNEGYLNKLKMVLLIGVLFVIFYAPYLRGLYFEPEQFLTQILLFSEFVLFWIYKLLTKDKLFLKTPIEYAAFGLTIIYLLSSFTAVSKRMAVSEFLKYAMYFAVFIMLSDLIRNDKERKIALWVMVVSAVGVCIIGIDSTAGSKIVSVLNSIFKAMNVNIEFFGLFVSGRIHSTMQYPNAFSSYLLAVFFVSLSLAMTSNKWIKSISSAISFILLVTFIFTISRGTYILISFAVLTFLLLIPKESKLKGVYNLLTIGIIAIGFSAVLSKLIFVESANKVFIWPLVILGSICSFFVRLTDDYVIKILGKINMKVVSIIAVAFLTISVIGTIYIFNASIPLEIKHTEDQKDGNITVGKRVILDSNKKYKLIFNVEGNSSNDKASYVYSINISSRNKTESSRIEQISLINERFNGTNGIEKKEIEFTVPDKSELVSIEFQNYYSGTSAKFYDAEIYDASNGKQVKSIVLKHKYSIAESVLSRFENITVDNSFNTRITFIKDGFKIFKDGWLFGAGGGAWSILNFKYQSFLYWSTQTHNYPLQVMIETGLFGIIILIMLFIAIVRGFIKVYKNTTSEDVNGMVVQSAIFTSIVFLFLHAAMDFDFSLSSIYLLTWGLISLLNANIRGDYANDEYKVKQKNRKLRENFSLSVKSLKGLFNRGINVYPVLMIVITIVVTIYPIIFYQGYIYSNKAFESYKEDKLDEAINQMDKAVSYDYLNTKFVTGYTPVASRGDIRLGYIDLVINKFSIASKQDNGSVDKATLNSYLAKAQKLAQKVEKHSKNNPELLTNLGIYYLNTTEKDKGIDFINKSVELKPFVPTQWQFKANAYYVTAIDYLQKGENEKGLKYINDIIKIMDEAKSVNASNLKPFVFNIATLEYIEKAYYIKNSMGVPKTNINNLVFKSIFEMDINSDNIPDQWNISDKSAIKTTSENGVLDIKVDGKVKNLYLSSRDLVFEPQNVYTINVELEDKKDIKSIAFKVLGVTDKVGQLNLKDNVYSVEISPSKLSENSKLILFIEESYKIKNVEILRR